MAQVAIFPGNDGGVCVLWPGSEWSALDAARKDVPTGVPFILVDESSLPDFSLQAAWVADFSSPDGYGIGAEAWFAEQAAKGASE